MSTSFNTTCKYNDKNKEAQVKNTSPRFKGERGDWESFSKCDLIFNRRMYSTGQSATGKTKGYSRHNMNLSKVKVC